MRLEEFLSEDRNYYEQRAREFRRDFLKFIDTEEYGVSNFQFDQAGAYLSFDTSVTVHALDVSLKDSTEWDFSIDKEGNVRLYSASAEQFFDLGVDQAVLCELKELVLKQNTFAGLSD